MNARAGPRPRYARSALAAFGLGLVHAGGFWPVEHWALSIASLAGLSALVRTALSHGASRAAAAGLGGAFGMGAFCAGLAWLFVSMHTYGGMPAAMAGAAVVLFSAYLSLYPALALSVAAALAGRAGPLAWTGALTGSWMLTEIARGWVMTGFPWLAAGYAQLDGPLDRLAPVLGVFGVGGAAVAVGALLAEAARSRRAGASAHHDLPRAARTRIACAALAIVLLLVPLTIPRDAWTRASGPPLDVRLVQGNVAQDMKFVPARTLAAMRDYAERFVAGRATLTILPETAWTVPWDRTPEPIARAILEHVERGHTLALGLPAFAPGAGGGAPRLTNSVMLIEPGRRPDPLDASRRYDKHHLVPFGEFVPLGFRWFVDMMNIPMGDFGRGDRRQPPFEVGGQRVAFNICYEDLFGEEIREALLGERGATVLANVSNIAWFGRSHALPQHLAIARLRSLETGRPMLRATNTGMTAAIDGAGRVIAQLEPQVAGTLDVRVQGTVGLTPFVRWGNAVAIVVALAAIAAASASARAGRRTQSR